MTKKAKMTGGRKAPTVDPMCAGRLYHHNGQRCEKCGGDRMTEAHECSTKYERSYRCDDPYCDGHGGGVWVSCSCGAKTYDGTGNGGYLWFREHEREVILAKLGLEFRRRSSKAVKK